VIFQLGTATSLMNAGPIGLLLGYIVLGSICFSVMVSLGEIVRISITLWSLLDTAQ
jgi:amino acid permease